jgi:hypothetical protein
MPAPEQRRRQRIEEIALTMPTYGHRPMTAELQHRRLPTGRDRVLRYMREANCFVGGAASLSSPLTLIMT